MEFGLAVFAALGIAVAAIPAMIGGLVMFAAIAPARIRQLTAMLNRQADAFEAYSGTLRGRNNG